MDKSKYTEIGGREAANRLLDDLDIYSEGGNRYYMQHGKVWMESGGLSGLVVLTLTETFSRKWYIKKPFDVRAEMLARPNEWIGAYEYEGEWWKLGLNLYNMCAVTQSFKFEGSVVDFPSRGIDKASLTEIKACIPIEDVPEEEWK